MELKLSVVKPPPPVEVLMFIDPKDGQTAQPAGGAFEAIKLTSGIGGNGLVGPIFKLGEVELYGGERLMIKFPNGKVHAHEICVSSGRMYLRAGFRGLKIAFEVDENDGLEAYLIPKK